MIRQSVASLVLALVACAPAQDVTAVDECLLEQYLQECDVELATELITPDEADQCRRKAPKEATRLLAGIPADCREGG